MKEAVVLLEGRVRKDPFGRIVVDTCASDEEHLRLPAHLPAGQDRHRCRQLLEEALDGLVGEEGVLLAHVSVHPLPQVGWAYEEVSHPDEYFNLGPARVTGLGLWEEGQQDRKVSLHQADSNRLPRTYEVWLSVLLEDWRRVPRLDREAP